VLSGEDQVRCLAIRVTNVIFSLASASSITKKGTQDSSTCVHMYVQSQLPVSYDPSGSGILIWVCLDSTSMLCIIKFASVSAPSGHSLIGQDSSFVAWISVRE
jgi:hypothetical protein